MRNLPANVRVYLAWRDSEQWIFLERIRGGEEKPIERRQAPPESDLIRRFEPGFIPSGLGSEKLT